MDFLFHCNLCLLPLSLRLWSGRGQRYAHVSIELSAVVYNLCNVGGTSLFVNGNLLRMCFIGFLQFACLFLHYGPFHPEQALRIPLVHFLVSTALAR